MLMKILLGMVTTIALTLAGCGQVEGGSGPGSGPGPGGGAGPGGGSGSGSGSGDEDCLSDLCVCPPGESCEHACTAGNAECHVMGATGQPVDVACDRNLECHVECATSASCEVECGGSAECHVTCPATGCTVTGCTGPGCVVSCGTFGEATYTGTTATCP